jgi:pyrimidine-nucleoside phosphorylase
VSKKVAGGADATVLDVKVGSGAFMKTLDDARELASELTRVGAQLGRRIECHLTDMDQPLGMAVGNANEVVEAIETLRGEGPEALWDVCLTLGAQMLVLGDVATDDAEARAALEDALTSGRALERFEAWVEAQGGDPRVASDTSLLQASPLARTLGAERGGFVSRFDAEGVGRAAAALGAGRLTKDDVIDPGAGLVLEVRVGDEVSAGDALATMRSADETKLDEAEARFLTAITISEEPPEPRPLFLT